MGAVSRTVSILLRICQRPCGSQRKRLLFGSEVEAGALCFPGPLDALDLHGKARGLVALLRRVIASWCILVDSTEEPKCKALLPHCYGSA